MATKHAAVGARLQLQADQLARLIPALERRGYQVIGPVVRDGAIVYDTVEKLEDMAAGWTAEQSPGGYRLKRREDGALFGWPPSPRSLKKFFHPSEIRLFSAERDNGLFRVLTNEAAPPRRAFLGVRPCDLAAVAIQDRVLLGDKFADLVYHGHRADAFIVAAQCTEAGGNCFCASMGTGPAARAGFDVALTELFEPERRVYLAEAGTQAGAEVLAELEAVRAPAELVKEAQAAGERAASSMRRRVETRGLKERLYEAFEHPRWEQVAGRCLSCANCTMVCPTCFCVTVEDSSDVTVRHAERVRKWDSCFTQSFSYIHGGSVRSSLKSRYRQWLTHKFAAWVDQFGTPGCVGCGRCITWCPVGIDITEELAAICGAAPAP